jgi:hypothetical protein
MPAYDPNFDDAEVGTINETDVINARKGALSNLYRQSFATTSVDFPSNLTDESPFYTVFRIKEREVRPDYGSGRGITYAEQTTSLQTIKLPLPPNLSTTYGVNYNSTEFGVIGAQIGSLAGDVATRGVGAVAEDAVRGILNSVADAINDPAGSAAALGRDLGSVAARLALESDIPGAVPIASAVGVALNPYQAVVFQSPNFRTHSFSYTLFAKNEQESQAIRGIIKRLKSAMLPNFVGTGGGFFSYPYIFEIGFVGAGDYLFRIAPSALTEFTVNYHGDGTPSYFGSSRAPTNVKINMTFQELTILTQKDVLENNY